jgi:filamentous hemagglutinin family protein
MRQQTRPALSTITRVIRSQMIAAAMLPGLSMAAPSGGSVVAGQANISTPGPTQTTIQQSSQSAILQWQSFGIGAGEQVTFYQPNASAVTLNRVVGGDASVILGHLEANGRVFLINPQGVLFGKGATVDVGGLVASTLDISNDDFIAGRYVFTNPGSGSVENRGQINARDHGFVVLASGESVSNAGMISARLGTVAVATGSQMTLDLRGDGLVNFNVDAATVSAHAGVSNAGDIVAQGGLVILSARTAHVLLGAAVNNSGRISAHSVQEHGGEILLSAEGGDIVDSGVLDVSGEAVSGGSVKLESGHDVLLAAGASILARGDDAKGGKLRVIAGHDLVFASGASIDGRGARGGGYTELSGHHGLTFAGDVQLGQGGLLVLDPTDWVIANGSAANGSCTASASTLCEAQLESQLQAGTNVSLIASHSITVNNLADNTLDGRGATGKGGRLFMGIGSGSDEAVFSAATGGLISFADASDSILLDQGFRAVTDLASTLGNISASDIDLAITGGALTTGALTANAGNITINASGAVTTGALTARDFSNGANLSISAGGLVDVKGDIDVQGKMLAVPVNPDGSAFGTGAGVTVNTSSGGITLEGAVLLDGETAAVTATSGAFQGTSLFLEADNGYISVRGAISLSGKTGAVNTTDAVTVKGASGFINAVNGNVDLRREVSVSGSAADVNAATSRAVINVEGASFSVYANQGAVDLGSGLAANAPFAVQINGTAGNVSNGAAMSASGAELVLNGMSDVSVNGLTHVTGTLGRAISSEENDLSYLNGVYMQLMSSSAGVTLHDVMATGTLDSAAVGLGSGNGVGLLASANGAPFLIRGKLTLDGSITRNITGADNFTTSGVFTQITNQDGGIEITDAVKLSGSIGSVTGHIQSLASGNTFSANGVFLNLNPVRGDLYLQQTLTVDGTLGSVTDGTRFYANGAQALLGADLGSVVVVGASQVSGKVGDVSGLEFFTVEGVNFQVAPFSGDATLGAVSATGSVGNVRGGFLDMASNTYVGGRGVNVSGALLLLDPDDNLNINGNISVSGDVTSLAAADFSGGLGAYVSITPFFGNAALRGVSVNGSFGSLKTPGDADSTFALGALLNASSFSSEGAGNLDFNGPLSVSGNVGTVDAGTNVQLTGAGISVNTFYGHVHATGAINLDGAVGNAHVVHGADVSGSYGYFASGNSYTALDGNVHVSGRIGDLSGNALTATGSTLNLLGTFGTVDDNGDAGPSLSVGGNITQTSSIGKFSPLQPDTSSTYAGAVTLDASRGGVSFHDVSADNIFIYFDSSSSIGSATLNAANYLEVFTPDYGPVLSGNSLTINADDVFFSSNTENLGSLSLNGRHSATMFFALMAADHLTLNSGGDLTLIGAGTRVEGQSVSMSGRNIYSEDGTAIVAGGLDMTASGTILLDGTLEVGSGQTQHPGDPALLERLRTVAPDLLPQSAQPNAYISADTVSLRDFTLHGDHVQFRSNYFNLGQAHFDQPRTFVQFEPLAGLPFFAESVNVQTSGLADVASRIRTQNGSVTPNIGRFDQARDRDTLGARPDVGSSDNRVAGSVNFTVVDKLPSFGQIILDSGLAGSTIVIGSSAYTGAIQISDELAVDVLPSLTNFVFLTGSGILGSDRISTNGQVVVLGGTLYTDKIEFYKLAAQQIKDYYTALDDGKSDDSDDDKDKSKEDEKVCK